MKEQAKLPALIAAVVALVAFAVYFGSKAMNAGNLDQGQVQYTPGKPPWQETDPAKKGPGGAPGGGGPGVSAAAPSTATVPPGMSAPTLGNGSK